MGCVVAKESSIEKIIECNEEVLGFKEVTIEDIKAAFFNLHKNNQISLAQAKKGFRDLIKREEIEGIKSLIHIFLVSFAINDLNSENENDEKNFLLDFNMMIIALYISSNSEHKEKAKAIFEIFDTPCLSCLDAETLHSLLFHIFKSIKLASNALSEQSPEDLRIHENKVSMSIKKTVEVEVSIILPKTKLINYEQYMTYFGRKVHKVDGSFFLPRNIRKRIMPYVFESKRDGRMKFE